MPDPIRVGVVGAGANTRLRHIPGLQAIDGVEVVVVCNRSQESGQRVADEFGIPRVATDPREVFEADDVDAVCVGTWPYRHRDYVIAALEAGKHVLVEKPLATSLADADTMLAAAERAERTLMVGHTFEHNPAVQKLRELVASGLLGRIYYIQATRVNLGLFQPDINVLWDLAPHDLSILLYVLGQMPIALRAEGRAYVQPGIEDVAWLTLDFPDGLTAQVHTSWLDPCKIRRVTLVGDRQMVVYDDLAPLDKITLYDRGVERPPFTDSFGEFQLSYRYGDVHSPRLDWVEPLKRECAHFVRCVREGLPPRSDGLAGRRVVAILAAASRSLAAGGERVELAPLTGEPPE